jgi:hypothetical protein
MKGQWIGHYSGNNEGLILINIDERQSMFEGVAYVNNNNGALPGLAAWFNTPTKARDFAFRTTYIAPIHPPHGRDRFLGQREEVLWTGCCNT